MQQKKAQKILLFKEKLMGWFRGLVEGNILHV